MRRPRLRPTWESDSPAVLSRTDADPFRRCDLILVRRAVPRQEA